MKINKEKLAELVALGDRELWCEVRKIAASYGFTLPEKTPSHSDMERLRSAVSDGAKLNMREALKIINDCRRSAGNG